MQQAVKPTGMAPIPLGRTGPYPESPNQTDLHSCIQEVLTSFQGHPTPLLQALIHLQQRLGWIPPQAQTEFSQALNISPGEIAGVVEFYHFLYDQPQGAYQLLLSDCVSDRFNGRQTLLARFEEKLGIREGELRQDGRVRLASTSCTGLCDQGPAALINGYPLPGLSEEKIDHICELIEAQIPLVQWPDDLFRPRHGLVRKDWLLSEVPAPGAALQRIAEQGSEAFMGELSRSGLRGRGGAGFETAEKYWSACRNHSAREHYVVCNADEGEPGTFKDRLLLESYPDLVFEGMTLCARVLGAKQGFLYLRGEYLYLYEMLQDKLQARRQQGLLGESIQGIPGFDFDIEIHLGAGAYVCGEESALIESLEGKRGVPRIRPPFPVVRGYRDQPTVVNNVETFACVTRIALHGGDAFAALGSEHSKGTKLHSISGDCARPGIYEFPWGVSLSEILAACGAEDPQAVQVGGPSGLLLGPEEFDRALGFEDLPTGGSLIVIGQQRDLFEVVKSFTHFFAHESCGFCTPCRAGTQELCALLQRFEEGRGRESDRQRLRELAALMTGASHCGLGKTAALPALQSLEKFPQIFREGATNQGRCQCQCQSNKSQESCSADRNAGGNA